MIVRLKPYLEPKLWGSKTLSKRYDDTLKDSIGEAWGISMIAGKESRIQDGDYKGMPFSILYEEHRELFGGLQGTFPLLVKVIDAKDDLSIQTHPRDGEYAKNEAWIILDHKVDANLVLGHKARSKETFIEALNMGKLEDYLIKVKVQKGDTFFIEGGKLHGIGQGIELFEIQQSSDTTYRVYDYKRTYQGKERDLHVEEALQLMVFPDEKVVRDLDNPYFHVEHLQIKEKTIRKSHPYGDYLYIKKGHGVIGHKAVGPHDFVFVSSKETYLISGDLDIIKSTILRGR